MDKLLKRIIPLLLAIGLLVYALKDISFTEIWLQFQQAHYGYIALVAGVTLLSYWIQGIRWQQPLIALGYQPTAFRATVAMQSGVIASMIVLGSGEVTRCLTLQRTDGVPFSHGVGSVVAERVLDILMLFVVMLLAFVLEFSRMQAYIADLTFASPTTIAGILAGGGVLGFLVLYGLWRIPSVRQHSFTSKLIGFGKGLWQGFSAIRRLPSPTLFIVLTVLNQLLAWLSTYLLLLSMHLTQSMLPTAALTIMAVASLGGLAVPTQGGVGTYHFLVSRALVLYGLSTAEGALVATFMHAVGFAINIVLSSLSFLIVPVLVQQRQERMRTEQEN